MRIEVIHPSELSAGEVALWRGWRRADDGLASPFLTPEWARLIGANRSDARLAVIFSGGTPCGFFGAQRRSRFSAMGLGAPISDYQAIVAATNAEVSAHDLCRALKVGRIDLTHVPAQQRFFAAHAEGEAGSWIVDTSAGVEVYRAAQKSRRADFVKQTDKKQRKLAREKGDIRFTALSGSYADFRQMLGWKRMQLLRSGQPSIWHTPWVSRVLEATFETTSAQLSGALFTMHAGDRLVAANYMLRSDCVLHDWLIAHNPAFEVYSPGVLLARFAVEWAAQNGVAEVDFGPGQSQYKRQLATRQRMLCWGSAAGVSASGLVRDAQYAARRRIERLSQKRLAALPGKAMRKIDLYRALAAPAG